MARQLANFIPDILEEHFEELDFLWGQRLAAFRSPEQFPRNLADLEERISAHIDGLLVGGGAAIPMIEPALKGEIPSQVFAAAYFLLRLRDSQAADLVWQAFLESKPELREAFLQAFSYGPLDHLEDRLREAAAKSPPGIASVALESLLIRSASTPPTHRLGDFFHEEAPAVRQAAWRIAARMDELEPPSR